MDLPEMTGSPNLIIVPQPETFRVLPWAPGVAWIQCNEYFQDGTPFHFSSRHLLLRILQQLEDRGMGFTVGLEVEWYLAKILEEQLHDENVGRAGVRGRPLQTSPPEPGFAYHSESNLDLMQPVLSELVRTYQALDLPIRSVENEWGPGQVECTFTAQSALRAADDLVLFRTATRQVCRRLGYAASFMCLPAISGYVASGWHLHQSLTSADNGQNLFMAEADSLTPLAENFLGGLLKHAGPASVFATPTVNGYRRFRPNSLAPNRATWGDDHRGVMIRVLGGSGDPATRLENRAGEPAANPYLFIASQLAAGLEGIDHKIDHGPANDDPYNSDCPLLPTSLADAVDLVEHDELFRRAFGDLYIDYFVSLKRSELARFHRFEAESELPATSDGVTAWEENEYFDFF